MASSKLNLEYNIFFASEDSFSRKPGIRPLFMPQVTASLMATLSGSPFS
jgi:hypothetical protein